MFLLIGVAAVYMSDLLPGFGITYDKKRNRNIGSAMVVLETINGENYSFSEPGIYNLSKLLDVQYIYVNSDYNIHVFKEHLKMSDFDSDGNKSKENEITYSQTSKFNQVNLAINCLFIQKNVYEGVVIGYDKNCNAGDDKFTNVYNIAPGKYEGSIFDPVARTNKCLQDSEYKELFKLNVAPSNERPATSLDESATKFEMIATDNNFVMMTFNEMAFKGTMKMYKPTRRSIKEPEKVKSFVVVSLKDGDLEKSYEIK